MADRVERLTNLLALLLETSEPLSLVEIAAELGGQYPDHDVARRQAFERDKAGAARTRRADRHRDPRRRAVRRSDPRTGSIGQVRARRPRSRSRRDAGAAGRRRRRRGPGRAVGSIGDLEARRGTRRRATTGLGTRPRPARVAGDPGGGGVAFGDRRSSTAAPTRTSIPGVCSCGEASGTSSVSTTTVMSSGRSGSIASTEAPPSIGVGPSGTFERPADFDPRSAFPADPKQIGQSADEAIEAHRAHRCRIARRRPCANSARSGVVRRHDDGSIDVRVPADNVDAFRSWVLGLLEHAVVLEPAGAAGARSSAG